MSKLEEVSSKPLVLVDSFDARKNHIFMFAFTILICVVYALFLWLVCSTRPGILSALLLFGSQIAMGFPAARAYYDLGVSNRETLHFIDPCRFNGVGHHHEVKITLGEIPLIFEKIGIQIQKYDKGSLDDLSDLVWFGIFVWASLSTASFYLGITGASLCIIGALVLVIACLGSYLSGYWIRRNYSFEDDLNHLQYYVERRLRNIDTNLSGLNSHFYIQVLERWRALVLVEFSLHVETGAGRALQYHLGFPSCQLERILVKAEDEFLQTLTRTLQQTTVIVDNGWTVDLADSKIVIQNESSDFSVSNRSTFVTSPSEMNESSKRAEKVFLKVLEMSK
ncbi:MAG: hypothetical protein ACFFFK_08595 [Candidatus Thorarchaeota archaeon]